MKYILFAFMGLVSFAATLAVALLLTGNMNRQALDRLLQRGPALEAEASEAGATEVGPLAQALREKEKQLQEREDTLDAREKELDTRMTDLETLHEQLLEQQKSIAGSMEDEDIARRARVRSTAISIAEMKADKAAVLLESLLPEEAAEILYFEENGKSVIDKGTQGKIFDALELEFATNVLRAYQEGGR